MSYGLWARTSLFPIYELLGPKGSLPGYMYEMMKKYNEGLELFGEHHWKRARSSFKEALKIVEDDGPSLTYVKRCEEFMKKRLQRTGTACTHSRQNSLIKKQSTISLYHVFTCRSGESMIQGRRQHFILPPLWPFGAGPG